MFAIFIVLAGLLEVEPARDPQGDPLPPGAIARLGTERFRNPYDIDWLAFAPDGKTIASGGYGGTACLWDAATGKLVRKFEDHPGRLLHGTFSPDGRLLAITDNHNQLFVWSLVTGEVQWQIPCRHVNAPAFSADGKSLAVTDPAKEVRIYDVATGKERHLVKPRVAPTDLALSPDGRRLALCESDDNFAAVRLYDVATGKRLRSYDRMESLFIRAIFTPDGKHLITGDDDGTICVWDFETEEPVRVIEVTNASPIVTLIVSANGQEVTAVAQNGKGGRYDLATGKQRTKVDLEDATGKFHTLSPDGRFLAVAHRDQLNVRNLTTGKDALAIEPRWEFGRTIVWSPTAPLAAIELTDGGLLLWNPLEPGKPRPFRVEDHSVFPSISADGKLVASRADDQIKIHDLATAKEIQTLPIKAEQIELLGFSPVDGTLAVGVDLAVHLIEATTGKVRAVVRDVKGNRIDFSPDGRTLAVRNGEDAVTLYETATGQRRGQVPLDGGPAQFAFTADSSAMIVVGSWYSIRLIHIGTGRVLTTLRERGPEIDALAVSPNGQLLAIGGLDGTELWDLPTGRRLALLGGHVGRVQALGFSPDGKYLLSAGNDRLAIVWDMAKVKTLPAEPPAPPKRTLDDLWADLAKPDALRSFAALTALAERPESLPYLKERLRRAVAPEPATLAKLLKELTSDEFTVREKAHTELLSLDRLAETALRKALAAKPAPDAARVLEEMLLALEGPPVHPVRLRELRAVEVLERIAIPSAQGVLETLASGAAEARSTEEARLALARIKRRATLPR